MIKFFTLSLMLASSFFTSFTAFSAEPNFAEAKKILRQHVYVDQQSRGTFYCECDWQWVGASGGRINPASCGITPRKNPDRASRLEWEHIVPASNFGRARQCWQQGGRENCTKNDPVFSTMEGDLFNLVPSVGEINGDRGNFNFSAFNPASYAYGQCAFAVDFKNRQANPPAIARGQIARTYFYMHDRYNIALSRQQQQLMMAWHKQYPPTAHERLVHDRIATILGRTNPFLTGEKEWRIGHKNSGEGLTQSAVPTKVSKQQPSTQQRATAILGNKNSKIYHLPQGCPNYHDITPKNRVAFTSEPEAQAAGYRMAKNCR